MGILRRAAATDGGRAARDEAADLVAGTAPGRLVDDDPGLELACQIAADTPDALVGDAGRLRQVLVNLVGNALKFTDRGEVVVRVHIESQAPDAVELHFTVTDTGMGIAAAQRQSIFQPFEQADGSSTRRYGGTGLGLAISSRLVALMGGWIWVDSELGAGSDFHFTLPVAAAKS